MAKEKSIKLSDEDVSGLMREHGVQRRTIEELMKRGVEPDDLDEVLDQRNFLASYRKEGGRILGQVSARMMAQAYLAVGKDTDSLESLVEKASGLAHRFARNRQGRDGTPLPSTSDFNYGVRAAINITKTAGVDALEDYDELMDK